MHPDPIRSLRLRRSVRKTVSIYPTSAPDLSVLNPMNEYLFQRPKKSAGEGEIWYDNMVVGENTLGKKMKVISHQAELSTIYTNHSIRATTITILDRSGFEARHINHVGKRTQKRKQHKNLQQNRYKHKNKHGGQPYGCN